jgi:hypothetical protein
VFDLQAQQAQTAHVQAAAQAIAYHQGPSAPLAYAPVAQHNAQHNVLYPSLEEYMGLAITPDMVQRSLAVVPAASSQVSNYVSVISCSFYNSRNYVSTSFFL